MLILSPENNIQALRNISFKLEAGQTLGITGQVGSGKSTILNLISRQYDVSSGQILLDGKDLREHNLNLVRRQCGVVPQEVFLFSDSIANNIAFGFPVDECPPPLITKAAQDAGVYENIMKFPEKFETVVGERGVTLSGGQKQRISIARAIIHQPKVLLFDDCLSAVDSETEELILGNLKLETADRTTVIVSHRISSIKDADLILFLKEGVIAEQGTHEELMELKGLYFELNQLQGA